MVSQIEFVSSHFNYTEEYVLEHTIDWLNAKFKQAQREKWEKSQANVWEGVKSLLVTFDIAFNKGKSVEKLMPSSYEEAISQVEEKKEKESTFVPGQWWLKD
ncbi:hypothetical protein [Priestia megaterium]|uniref:hypothetical protein n=1 Tax=Priestia megaterium TaxID=1404 RepID=UPI002E1F1DFD|nr:hypothetical protein [Priestia megaterium]MED4102194.1 hypothetical protein [Priestia megaterium]MED4116538.1 hypothetical protein [Priestia megaterium]MED4142621.1 hypothetical protein [Priestia megaterium]